MVKYGICYISVKNYPIATKRTATISIELWGSNATIGFDLDLEFLRSNVEFAISQPKMVWLPRNEKQTYRLNLRAQMWPSDLTLAMTLTLNFQDQIWNLLFVSQKKHETKSNLVVWILGLKCDHGICHWPWPWPWIFKVMYEICYIRKKWSNCHETKSKHIDWTPGFKCAQWVWPWLWLWHLNVEGQMWPWSFDDTHDLDHGFWWANFEIVVSQNGRADCHCTKSVSRSFMTMTIWWPRSGVWIYQIVTGVTSVVDMPSTHLFFPCLRQHCNNFDAVLTIECHTPNQRKPFITG